MGAYILSKDISQLKPPEHDFKTAYPLNLLKTDFRNKAPFVFLKLGVFHWV